MLTLNMLIQQHDDSSESASGTIPRVWQFSALIHLHIKIQLCSSLKPASDG